MQPLDATKHALAKTLIDKGLYAIDACYLAGIDYRATLKRFKKEKYTVHTDRAIAKRELYQCTRFNGILGFGA